MSRYTVPKVGARIIEGQANGFSVANMCWALARPPAHIERLKYQINLTNTELGTCSGRDSIGPLYTRPSYRTIGMFLAAGLMRYKDLQRPGQLFAFTMEPDADCPIQYRDDCDLHTEGAPLLPLRVPKGMPRTTDEIITLAAPVRNYLTAMLLGMGDPEISQAIVSDYDRSDVRTVRDRTGLKETIQLAAHCVVNGAIEIPEEILTDPEQVKPIIYTRPATLELPLGEVA